MVLWQLKNFIEIFSPLLYVGLSYLESFFYLFLRKGGKGET